MHQEPAYVNAVHAIFMALHFWPILDPSPAKTAEIRHFRSPTDTKTVQVQSKQDLRERIERFIAFFNNTLAKPFRWTKTGKPLTA